MKTIILLRHAKSSWDDPSMEDRDRPLNQRGERAAGLVAAFLRHEGLLPEIILCSSALRTRETLARVQAVIGDDTPALIEDELYLASAAKLLERLRCLGDDAASVLLIGHNPGLEDLAATLIEPRGSALEEKMAVKFPTAGLAVIRADAGTWAALKRRSGRLDLFVIPKDLV
ncbi:SixA phosphatase family protein [Zavarzinia compransoris]|uniref:SixA phosphatase family protein n=1 Tax=Zavarzinia compransoris TaxID=1264899 RepID=UPI001414FDB5|nr:histidine phosphatase family protein [Zavarzinia compransoris]